MGKMLFESIYPAPVTSLGIRTSDATKYLFRSIAISGLLVSKRQTYMLYWMWSLCVLLFCVIYFPISFLLSFVFYASDFSADELISTMQFAFNAWGFSIRLSIIWLYHKRFYIANAILDKLDQRSKTKEELATVREVAALGNRIFLSFFVLYSLYTISNSSSVLFIGRPPFNFYNPLIDWRRSKVHLYAEAVFEFILVGICTFIELIIDCYSIIYVICIRAQVKNLRFRLNRLADELVAQSKQDVDVLKMADRRQQLIDCIQDHKLMLIFCDNLRPVISGTIFVQLLACGSILGLAMINLLLFVNVSTGIGTGIYLFAVLLQTFPLCYLCNCLIEDCYDLANAVFHSNWFTQDVRYMKTLRYFLQRVQKPMTFSAMGVFPITLSTNLTFAKFAFTVYTLANESKIVEKFTKTE